MLAGSALIGGVQVARAADPQPYNVTFKPSGDSALDTLLRQSSSLEQLRSKSPVGPFALIGRAEADRRNFITVLESEGYDSGSVAITINGHALSDPALAEKLESAPSAPPAPVVISVDRGPLYHIGAIETPGLNGAIDVKALGISEGQPAKAAPILQAATKLETALHNHGYAFAKVSEPIAYADPDTHTLSLRYPVTLGAHVAIGAVEFSGLKHMKAAFLHRHITLRPGQPYSTTALDRARSQLLDLGVFSSVTAQTAETQSPPGQVPVTFVLRERKLHRVAISASYSTDLGISADVSWMDRNLFGGAQKLTLSVGVTQLGSSGSNTSQLEPGYDAKVKYQAPDFWRRQQGLTAEIEALKEYLPAYNRTGVLADIGLSRPLIEHLTASYGLGLISERVEQQDTSRSYLIGQMPLTLDYDTTNSLLDPTRGVRLSLRAVPSVQLSGGSGLFIITELIGNTYINLEAPGRGVLALRGVLGRIFGASQFQIPPDQRFYAGGTGTVRGFTYQTVGPLFADGTPQGGTSIDAIETEFRQRIGKSFGIAPFVDAGQVSANGAPFTGTLRVGAGLGVLYYTGIGPIRLTVGVPVNRPPGGASVVVYIGLGQAF